MTDYLTVEECGRLLDESAKRGARDDLIVRIMMWTGMRVGEACALTCGDVDTEKGAITLSKVVTTPSEMLSTPRGRPAYNPKEQITFLIEGETGFTGEKYSMFPLDAAKKFHHKMNEMIKLGLKASQPLRVVPLVDRATRAMLSQWIEGKHERDYLFVSQKPHSHKLNKAGAIKSYRLGKWQMQRIVKDCMLAAGIDPPKCHVHNLRHTYAVHSLKRGMDIITLQRILGHTKVQTTSIYLRFVVDDLIARAESIGSLYGDRGGRQN